MNPFVWYRFAISAAVVWAIGLAGSGVAHANTITVPLDLETTTIANGNRWVTPNIDFSGFGPDPLQNAGDSLQVLFSFSGPLPRISMTDSPLNLGTENVQLVFGGTSQGSLATLDVSVEFLGIAGDFDGAVPVPVATGLVLGIANSPFAFSTGNAAVELTDTSFSFGALAMTITLDNITPGNVGDFIAFETVNMSFSADTVEFVPEPGTAALLGLGLTGLGIARRRKRE